MNTPNPSDDAMKKRIDEMFSGQDLPSYASLSEVNVMKARIRELEEKLQQSTRPVVTEIKLEEVHSAEEEKTAEEGSKPGFFRNLLTPPAFGNIAKNRIAKLQHQILLGIISTAILAVIAIFLSWNGTGSVFGLGILTFEFAVLSVAVYFLRRGNLQVVSWILIGVIYTILIVSLFVSGFTLATIMELALIVTLAGLLLHPWQVVLVSFSTVVMVFVAPNIGLPSSFDTNNLLFTSIILALEGALLTIASSTLENTFKEIDKSTKALVISNKTLQDLSTNLEERVASRTHDLELAAEVGKIISGKVDNLYSLLEEAVETIRSRFNLYYAQVYITDRSGRTITLRAGTGDIGKQLMKRGHHLLINSGSLNGRAASEKRTVIVSNTTDNPNFLPNPLLPFTRSEMSVPLIIGDKVVGVLDMQSDQVNVLTENNADAFEALAGQLAIAIQNAALFEQVKLSRLELEDQTKKQSYENWQNFLNAIEREEKLGYVFDQSDVLPLINAQEIEQKSSSLSAPIQVAGAEIGSVQFIDDTVRVWTPDEEVIVQSVVSQLSVHVDTLRLLAESDKYRQDAELSTKRLTVEGWNDYLNSQQNTVEGFIYSDHKVLPLNGIEVKTVDKEITVPLQVQSQSIGEILIEAPEGLGTEEFDVLSAVSRQLSNHIENLRLFEQSNESRKALVGTLQQLSANEARLAEALDIARLGNWEYDVEKDIFTFNDHFYSVFRTNVKEVGSYKLSSAEYAQRFVHPDDLPIVGVEIEKALTSKDRFYSASLEHRIIFPDGTTGYISVNINVERDENGKILRYYGANQDVTERKQAEEVIRINEARLAEALEIARLGNWEYDPDKDIFTFNDNFYAVFRTNIEQVGSYQMSSAEYAERFVHPDDAELVGIEIGKAMTTTELHFKQQLEHRIIFPDGSIGHIAVNINVERDENRKILRWYGANQDITERKKAAELVAARAEQLTVLNRVMEVANSSLDMQYILQTATDEFRTLMNAYSAGVLLLDEKGEMLTLTTESYADSNMPKLVGRAMPIASNPATDSSIKSGKTVLVADAQTDPILKPIHEIMKMRNIQSVLVTPLFSRNKVIGVFSIDTNNAERKFDANDITLIETLAKQLASAIENVQLFEETQHRAADLSTVAAVSTTTATVLDPDELLKTVVNITKERFGLYHAHIYLNNQTENGLTLAAGAGEVGQKMLESGITIDLNTERSLVARAARERRAVIINDVSKEEGFLPNALLPNTHSEMAVPMLVGEKVLGVFDIQSDKVGAFTGEDGDIYTTLAAQVAVALQNARLYVEQASVVTQLRELDRLKSSFLANMSHELRTPLNSILGFTDVMLEGLDGDLTEYMDNDLRLIQKNGQHLLHLINDVLDMAKIESGRMNLNIETCNMNDVMEDVIRITSSLANEKNIALYIDPESDKEVAITVDRTRLRQVLINLVNNSIKFTDKGSVSVRATRQQENVLLCIKDTGIGIPPAHLESVFQEFTQVDTSTTRKAGGTGLGLPISRRLIEMHGGRLWGESTGIDGEGASFYVLLPLEAKVSEAVAIEKV